MGPGESYMGRCGRSVQQNGYWSKDPGYGPGPYLRRLAGDVMLRHYGVRDTCRMFGDMVYVTALATAICMCKRRRRHRML